MCRSSCTTSLARAPRSTRTHNNVSHSRFVAAISEIGQQLWEDETISRMDEATMVRGQVPPLSGSGH